MKLRDLVVVQTILTLAFLHVRVQAEEGAAATTRAIAEIFADEHIHESVLTITTRAAAMSVEERYRFLAGWVLPNEHHESLRVQVDFTPTQPAPPVDREGFREGRRVISGGQLVSPVLDLVDAAAACGKLEELRQQIEKFQATSLLDQKNRLALLSIILLKQQKLEDAFVQIDAFSQLCLQEQPDDVLFRAAEAILFVSSLPFAEVTEVVGPTVDRVVNRHRSNQVRSSWSRQIQSLRSLQLETADHAASVSTSQWGSFSTISGLTRGVGIPSSRWTLKRGQADNTASHGDDYLFFAIPMRGDFQVECDVTAFGWTETRLLVGGTWVSPNYDYVSYQVGNMQNHQQRRPIEPRLMKGDGKLHYRTEVRDGVATTFTEGRLIHTEPLADNCDPWIAIRNGDVQEGTAWNVRVTGAPVIPETIPLTPTSSLASWLPYYGETMHQWQGIPTGGIHGASDHDFTETAASSPADSLPLVENNAVTYHEQAIFYQRPMLEDGTIEYEFFYSEGQQTAHPMLDRLCFLMNPEGVRIHWLTDGLYDRTELSPGNETVEAANRRGPNALPLLANAWNRVSVTLKGDVINILLNDQLVYQRTLESTNQRHFGFFYYADQSELNVRNVQWTGQWPRELMAVKDQELAIDHAEFLDEKTDHLKAVFEYDFVKDGMDLNRISAFRGNVEEHFRVTPEGLLAIRPGPGGYQNTTIAPNIEATGDFDITVEYDDFRTSPSVGGSSSLMLVAAVENVTSDECFITRRHMYDANGTQRQVVQCAIVQKTPDGEKRDYFITKPMEERSGRLRLARRGSKVYFLSAEGRSPSFRVWGSRDFPTDPVSMQGIRLVNQMHQKGESSVLWKYLSVRAESFSVPAIDELDPRIVALNKQRSELPVSVVYDFTKDPPDAGVLYRWMDLREWDAQHKGLRIQAEGSDSWDSAGVSTLHPISGDFDITTDVELISFDKPRADDPTAVFLQVDSSDALQTQLGVTFEFPQSGFADAKALLRQADKSGEFSYKAVGTIRAKSVASLRIARRGKRWTTMARMADSGRERVIAESDLNDGPVPIARLLLHTGGANRTSEILLKKFEIHAEEYAPVPVQQSPLESLLDLFK